MKTLTILLVLFSCGFCIAQNLVPNPSFEDTLGCPMFYPDLEGVCESWHSYSGTCDYMNDCSPVCGYYNQFGFQEPHSGNAYCGLGTYHVSLESTREHLGVSLIESLEIGTTYYVSFFVCAAWNVASTIATNKMGGLLTTYEYNAPQGLQPLPNYSTIYEDEIISDTLQWTKISASFIADSMYGHLSIGCFFDDSMVDTLHIPYQGNITWAYYYVDDVCLSADSLYAATWTGTNDLDSEKNVFKLYPNPCADFLTIKCPMEMKSIQVFNPLGQLQIRQTNLSKSSQIIVSSLSTGFYIVKAETQVGFYTSCFQKE